MLDPCFEEVRSGIFGPSNYDELIGSLEGNEGFGHGDYFLVGKEIIYIYTFFFPPAEIPIAKIKL